jgi:hypothetical protein
MYGALIHMKQAFLYMKMPLTYLIFNVILTQCESIAKYLI